MKVSPYLCLAQVSKYINIATCGSSASAAVRNAAGSAGQRFGAFVKASNFAILRGKSTHGATSVRFDARSHQINLVSRTPCPTKMARTLNDTYLQLLREGKGQFQLSFPIYQHARLSSRPIFTLGELTTERSVPWQACNH